MPSMAPLSCATKEDLLAFIKTLCRKHPAVREEVATFSPELPVAKMLAEIDKAGHLVEKKLPYDRWGRGNGDSYAYNRVRTFISQFAKVVTQHLKTIEKSGQVDKAEEFLGAVGEQVSELHEFHDPSHNAAKTRLLTAIGKAKAKFGLADGDEDDAEGEGEEESGGEEGFRIVS